MSNNLTTVYIGTWTDHTRGKWLGSLVTLSTREATLLVAFIAIFDAWVANILWSMVAFLIHRHRASANSGDGVHHQIQSLLRNASDPFCFARDIVEVGWRWRKRADYSLRRTLPYALLSISMTILFSVAGVWSARIASTGAVLLTGVNCGIPAPPLAMVTAQEILFNVYARDQDTALQKESIEYAQTCYKNPLTGGNISIISAERFSPGASCKLYIKPALTWTSATNIDCPFADGGVCSVPPSEILQMDTGYLSSLHDLGLNTKPSDSITFRQVKTCSPLKTTGFSNNSFTTTNLSGDYSELALYSYGAYTAPPWIDYPNDTAIIEWIIANNITMYYPKGAMALRNVPLSLATAPLLNADWKTSEQNFFPDRRIAADELPVSLFFLQNRALYIGDPVEDTWFNATQSIQVVLNGQSLQMYQNDVPVTVLGCVEQLQICNPNEASPLCSDLNTTWTTLGNGLTAYWTAEDLNFTDTQKLLAQIIVNVMVGSSFGAIAAANPQDLLLASTMIEQGYIASLPSNQWQIEIQHWMAVSLAYIQRTMLYFITGPTIEEIGPYWSLASGPEALELWGPEEVKHALSVCKSQMIKSTAYQSFSVLGICINFILGGLFIIGGLVIRYGAPKLPFRFPITQKGKRNTTRKCRENSRRNAWRADYVLQLQRMAYESVGLGDWEIDDASIPITSTGQVFDRRSVSRNELEHGAEAEADEKSSVESVPLVEKHDSPRVSDVVTISTYSSRGTEQTMNEATLGLPYFHFEERSRESLMGIDRVRY